MRQGPIALLLLMSLSAAPAGAQCSCDCDGNGRVGVHDLLRLVSLSFAPDNVDRCPRFLGIWIQIHDLVSCVDAALNRTVCLRTPTRSTTPTPTRTESAAATPNATSQSTETPSPTSTPSSEDEAAAALASEILEEIAIGVCKTISSTPGGGYDVYPRDAGATLDCTSFTGHQGHFDLMRYTSADAAEHAFGTPEPEESTYPTGGGFMRELRWKPLCCPNLGGVSTRWKWRRDCWLAAGTTFDDTHYIFSPQGPIVVDALVESGRLDDLFALCPPSP